MSTFNANPSPSIRDDYFYIPGEIHERKNNQHDADEIPGVTIPNTAADVIEYPLIDNPFQALPEEIKIAKISIYNYLKSYNLNKIAIISVITQLISFLIIIYDTIRGTTSINRFKTYIVSSALSIMATLALAFNITDSDSIEQLEKLIPASVEEISTKDDDYTRHLANINGLLSRVAVREYIYNNNLQQRIRLPSCTWDELVSNQQPHLSWIIKSFKPEFLAMWFNIPPHKVAHYLTSKHYELPPMTRQNLDLASLNISAHTMETIQGFLSRFFGIFFSWTLSLFSGEKFKKRDIIDGILLGKDVSSFTGNLVEDLVNKGNSREASMIALVEEYTSQFNAFMEIPTHEFARNNRKIYDIGNALQSCAKFIRESPKDMHNLLFPLQGLFTAVTQRRNDILNSAIPQFKRQEPFIVLIQGSGAIGKTRLIQEYLVPKVISELLDGGSETGDYIEIRHDDKYWPPLSGQRIAFFDEVGTVGDLREDLLLSNVKGICSPAYFNCPAADVEHKITPCPFHVIFAATNCNLYDLQGRLSSSFSSDSIYPIWRRCLVVEGAWDEQLCGKFDHNNPSGHRSDFSHIKLKLMKWNQQIGKLDESTSINKESLFGIIRDRYRKMEADHVRTISMSNMVKQVSHRIHYSCHLRGPPGSGKTPNIIEISKNLAQQFSFPVVSISNFSQLKTEFTERCIFVLDDLFDRSTSDIDAQVFLNFYNNLASDGSVFLFGSNLPSNFTLPNFRKFNISIPRKHPYKLAGVTRRLGFVGNFEGSFTPDYNDEIVVVDSKSFIPKPYIISYMNFLPIIPILLLSIFVHPISSLALLYLYRFRPSYKSLDLTLNKYVYNRYVNFLKMRKQFIQRNISYELDQEFTYELHAKNLSDIDFSNFGYNDLVNVYFDREQFDVSEFQTWKTYVHPDLASKFRANYQQFSVNCTFFDFNLAIKEVERIARIFMASNIEPRIKVKIHNVGYIYCIANDIFIYKPLTSQMRSNIYNDSSDIVVARSDGFTRIPFTDVFNKNVNIPLKYELCFEDMQAYSLYVRSSQFLSQSVVRNFLVDFSNTQLKHALFQRSKACVDKVSKFLSTPLGLFCKCIFSSIFITLTTMYLTKFVINCVPFFQKKKKIVGDKKPKSYDTDEDVRVIAPHKPKKPIKKKNPNYDTDNEQPIRSQKLKDVFRGQMAKRQDVKTLVDMNDHDAYKPYIDTAYQKCRNNMAMLYIEHNVEPILEREPANQQACYALFIKRNMFVTVGHVSEDLKTMPRYSLYVGCDSFRGKFYKCKLVRVYKNRDLSVWTVDGINDFPDISNVFLSRREMYENMDVNVAFQRFAPGKTEQWIQGACQIVEQYYAFDCGGIQEFGVADFACFDIMLTYYGDCGLPYYIAEKKLHNNRILGIHCMGNVEGYACMGVLSLIYKDDIKEWTECAFQKHCTFCGPEKCVISKSLTPKCENHELIWSPVHESSPITFREEILEYSKIRGNFTGLIIKNSGPTLRGSIEHSHTQFLHNVTRENMYVTNGWKSTTAGDLGILPERLPSNSTINYCIKDIDFPALMNIFSKLTFVSDFRIYANVYNKDSKRRATVALYITPGQTDRQTLDEFSKQTKFSQQGNIPLPLSESEEAYVSSDISDIVTTYISRHRRGLLPDIPFEIKENNATVKVLGVAHRNMSPLPNGTYYQTPFSTKIDLEPHKYPVRFDSYNAPEEVKKLMETDRMGFPDSRITAALKWAHPLHSPSIDLRIYAKNQYRSNILQYYANLTLLTDKQVMHGYPSSHRLRDSLSGLEIDSSIGWTIKQMFNVQKKSDVIALDPSGNYKWRDNDAALYCKEMYQNSKQLAYEGRRYWTAFNELLKMEKLKKEKRFLPRSFMANDLNGVLMERYILGEFCARSMKWDRNVAIGMNFYSDFDAHYRYLAKFKNMFTGDYKNFDRTIPVCVFDDMRELLTSSSEHIRNELHVCFSTLSRRVQVTGTALTICEGGMPSGCLPTAPLNSKLNDYMIYTAYVAICWRHDRGDMCEYVMYDRHVHRRFYGDDVQISVSDDVATFFHLPALALELKTLFGMEMTSSAKDGNLKYFETWEEASFCSRFVRKLDKYPFYVGALKKISINSHFHYVTSIDENHLGSLFTVAQYEAALWENEYFLEIQESIRVAIRIKPNISKYFNFRSRNDIQEEIYRNAFAAGVGKMDSFNSVEAKVKSTDSDDWNDICDQEIQASSNHIPTKVDDNISLDSVSSAAYNKFLTFIRNLPDSVVLGEKYMTKRTSKYFNKMSLYCKLNELFQKGEVTKPFVSFTRFMDDWNCEIEFTHVNANILIKSEGRGVCKAEARENASAGALSKLNSMLTPDNELPKMTKQNGQYHNTGDNRMCKQSIKPKMCNCSGTWHDVRSHNSSPDNMRAFLDSIKFVKQMNVSKGAEHSTPGTQMIQADPSIAPDTGIATNTMTVSPSRVINPLAMALDNPAGTGAAFDKKDSIYGIYSRWTEKNTTINGSLSQGTEVFRLSLDPNTLPRKIREYIMFHDSIIPQIDIQILIGGAAGSIGWLKLGWVPDDTKRYTLDDLQLVASEELNLNNTLTMQTILNDNRRSGLFRLVKNDPEPWPALVLMIDHPALNVQRNNDVSYPVFVNVRLGPNCCLMQPYNNITSTSDAGTRINLQQILQGQSVDLLIGTASVPDVLVNPLIYPDCGWNTGTFNPQISLQQLYGATLSAIPGFYMYQDLQSGNITYPIEIPIGNLAMYHRYYSIYYAYGEVDAAFARRFYIYGQEPTFNATVYTIPKLTMEQASIRFACTTLLAFENGCLLKFDLDPDYVKYLELDDITINSAVIVGESPTVVENKDQIACFSRPNAGYAVPIGGEYGGDELMIEFHSNTNISYSRILAPNCPVMLTAPFDINNVQPATFLQPAYEYTFIQTGNNAPSTALPSGLKFCAITRPGTSSTQSTENGFFPLNAPGMDVVFRQLEAIRVDLDAEFLQFDVVVNGITFTSMAYGHGFFLGRTSLSRMIRSALSTNIVLDNIVTLASVQGIPALPSTGFTSWTTTPARFVRRFDFVRFTKQSGILMGLGGAAGMFGELSRIRQFDELNKWRDQYQMRQLEATRQLYDMNNLAQSRLSRQNFDQRMEQLGRSSVSSQNGQLSRAPETATYTPNSSNSSTTSSSSSSSGSLISELLRTDLKPEDLLPNDARKFGVRNPKDPLPQIPVDQEFIPNNSNVYNIIPDEQENPMYGVTDDLMTEGVPEGLDPTPVLKPNAIYTKHVDPTPSLVPEKAPFPKRPMKDVSPFIDRMYQNPNQGQGARDLDPVIKQMRETKFTNRLNRTQPGMTNSGKTMFPDSANRDGNGFNTWLRAPMGSGVTSDEVF